MVNGDLLISSDKFHSEDDHIMTAQVLREILNITYLQELGFQKHVVARADPASSLHS